MTRLYAEEVDVRRGDDAPEQFLWHDRLYLVRAVLAHWVESGRWWRRAQLSLDEGEREFWRVEAGTGAAAPVGVYDLCFAWSDGHWSVARVQD